MTYIITLNNINDSDLQKVGYRALDFAKIFQAKHNTPMSFVIPNSLREEFLLETKVGLNIRNILKSINYENESRIKEAYVKIKELFEDAEFPKELVEHLQEAYNSLAVGIERQSAADLLKEEEPTVNLIASPDYMMGMEDMQGIIMNLKGLDNFLLGLKSCWLSVYLPELLIMRNRKKIVDFNVGVIVQRFIRAEASAETFSKGPLGDYEITVRAYLGLPDILKESSKDVFSVSKEYLTIESSKKARQEYKVTWGDEDNKLVKVELGVRGSEQKLTDKAIMEVARLTKRASSILKFNFKGYFMIRKEVPYFFFVSRFLDEPAADSVEAKQSTMTVSEAAEPEVKEESEEVVEEVTEEVEDEEVGEEPESEEYVDEEDRDENDEFILSGERKET